VDRRELILRDWLAVDRTILANERTLLAYIRTALAGAIVGGSLLKFFDSAVAKWSGIMFLIAALFAAIIGTLRYLGVRRRLGKMARGAVSHTSHVTQITRRNLAVRTFPKLTPQVWRAVS
jgi:putative membrane protein